MAKTVNRFDGRVGKLLKSECYSELMDDDYCNVMIDAHKEFCFTLWSVHRQFCLQWTVTDDDNDDDHDGIGDDDDNGSGTTNYLCKSPILVTLSIAFQQTKLLAIEALHQTQLGSLQQPSTLSAFVSDVRWISYCSSKRRPQTQWRSKISLNRGLFGPIKSTGNDRSDIWVNLSNSAYVSTSYIFLWWWEG